jgi:hypothetical protein
LFKRRAIPDDKPPVNGLIDNARKILDTAMDAGRNGLEPTDWTIFFGPEGGLEMIAGTETPLDSLTWTRGARMAWQVKHLGGGVRVEGRAASERCQFELGAPQHAARMLLGNSGMYQLIPAE